MSAGAARDAPGGVLHRREIGGAAAWCPPARLVAHGPAGGPAHEGTAMEITPTEERPSGRNAGRGTPAGRRTAAAGAGERAVPGAAPGSDAGRAPGGTGPADRPPAAGERRVADAPRAADGDPRAADTPRVGAGVDGRRGGGVPAGISHVNEVHVVGRVSAVPRARPLGMGELVVWRMAVERPRPAGGARRSDWITCAAADPGPGADVRALRVGDVLEIRGTLRRRFWQSRHGPVTPLEVEVRRAEPVLSPPEAVPRTCASPGP